MAKFEGRDLQIRLRPRLSWTWPSQKSVSPELTWRSPANPDLGIGRVFGTQAESNYDLPWLIKSRVKTCIAPSLLDWRKKATITRVKNQGDCGSCWPFPFIGAMEEISTISTRELISFFERELVHCDTTNTGYEGGYMDYTFE